jgi:hypothetical protein
MNVSYARGTADDKKGQTTIEAGDGNVRKRNDEVSGAPSETSSDW